MERSYNLNNLNNQFSRLQLNVPTSQQQNANALNALRQQYPQQSQTGAGNQSQTVSLRPRVDPLQEFLRNHLNQNQGIVFDFSGEQAAQDQIDTGVNTFLTSLRDPAQRNAGAHLSMSPNPNEGD